MPSSNITLIARLRNEYEIVRSQNISSKVLQHYDLLFKLPEQRKLRNDMLALIEQIICIRALKFAGTNKSTFTHYIIRARKFHPKVQDFLFHYPETTT
mmetsp:Transcript_431/g.578  ORF Transcript_431/g.578 Transcript_431/m.578 type:complete len:98 (+) Transcript_431:149-442(+)